MTKIIILAAGQGIRLQPFTNNKPKCMVEYQDKPIINHILSTIKQCGIQNIALVDGYQHSILREHLKKESIHFYHNHQYNQTNMVSTFFCAKEFMNSDFLDEDLIISYSDIVYKDSILQKLIESQEDFNVIVDQKWKELWLQRMEDPLQDAETLKIENHKIIELGQKPNHYHEIQGQYIGLIKISKKMINKIIYFYENLNKKSTYDGKDFDNMYMTSFIQLIINHLSNVYPTYINGGWVEIDSIQDLNTHPI